MSKLKKVEKLNAELGNIDIYLLDQIMKGNYSEDDCILDAGCGGGRNMHWFIKNGYNIHGIDINPVNIENLVLEYPALREYFKCGDLVQMPYENEHFDHIICNAVLHFASSKKMFLKMCGELVRILKPNGTIFIRTVSDIGIDKLIKTQESDLHLLPDGSTRFLVTRELISELIADYNLSFIEPVKSVNVHDLRVMTTLLLGKR